MEFKYQALSRRSDENVFRLLELLPGTTQPLHCRLIHATLQDEVRYEAISYRWGDSTRSHEIICNAASFLVTRSLYTALKRFRKADVSRFLWADQICINQDDINERNHQVGVMRHIYANALRTLIWLGDSDADFSREEARIGFALAGTLASYYKVRQRLELPDKRDILQLSPTEMEEAQLPRVTDISWLCFNKICCREWFDRVWVIQEVFVSRQAVLYCHSYNITWDDYYIALICAEELRVFYFLNAGTKSKLDLPKLHQQWKWNPSISLVQLIMEFSRYAATENRDKIYALVGLADKHDKDHLAPDYHLNEAKVFLRTTVTLLEKSRNLDMLSLVNLQSPSTSHRVLPHWVPCFDNYHHIAITSEWERCGRRALRFSASRQYQCRPTYSLDSKELALEGYILDSIGAVGSQHIIRGQKIGSPFAAAWDGAVILHLMATGENLTRHFDRHAEGKYFTGEVIYDVFWQTMIAGCTEDEFETIREKYLAIRIKYPSYRYLYALRLTQYHWICALLLGYLLAGILIRAKLGFSKPEDLRFFEHQSMAHDRRIFRSAGGFLGLGPAVCKQGDKIVLARGGKVPLILRPRGNKWMLLGDAYVHGIMYGEAFENDKCEKIWLI